MAIGKITDLTEVKSIRDFLDRNGMQMKGLRRATKTVMKDGYPKEEFKVTFNEGPYAAVRGPAFLFEDDKERERIVDDLRTVELPKPIPHTNECLGTDIPEELKGAHLDERSWSEIDWSKDEVVVPLHDENGGVVMIERKFRAKDGTKGFDRWVYFDDFVWRREDLPKFPLWGLDQLEHGAHTVFLHEGIKAASAGRRFYDLKANFISERQVIKDHPWYSTFSKFRHLGWIGGANRASSTDWGYLKKLGVKRVIIVPDNDTSGREAAYEIAQLLLGVDVFVLPMYPAGWPMGWDVADGFDKLPDGWEDLPKNPIDITRMTTESYTKSGMPYWELVKGYPQGLAYVKNKNSFYSVNNPFNEIGWERLGKHYADHIHAGAIPKLAGMVTESQPQNAYFDVAFEPERGVDVYLEGKRFFNIWRQPTVVPKPMTKVGWQLWVEYFERLVPDPYERKRLMQWVATTVARPRRKYFGVILHGDEQGTGKTLLVDEALRPLIGQDYVYAPSLEDIRNRFNGWRVGKVLIYADELKGDKNMTASDIYNRLKTDITAPIVRIEEKGKPHYELRDFCKMLVNSNMDVPLFMEASDRRWLVVGGTQIPLDKKHNDKLREWIRGDGLAEIYHWCLNYESEGQAIDPDDVFDSGMAEEVLGLDPVYIPFGANAPMTAAKMDLISNSKTRNQKTVASLLEALGEYRDGSERPVVVASAVTDDALSGAGIDTKTARKARYGKIGIDGWWFCDARNSGGSHVTPARGKFDNIAGRPRYVLLFNDAAKRVIDAEYKGAIEVLSAQSHRYNPKDGDWQELIRIAKELGIYVEEGVHWVDADLSWRPKGRGPDGKPKEWPERPDVVNMKSQK
ncbi:primase-helicase family protein [Shimia thalassica]|uniref:primase-helicase family protein n=1 Tax=Shimia thalassica TaxID=1715693 RepID=UPI002736C01C|nr:DUF5906 domain-containing protein [Shimia thalassica]MDP2520147.1 DUF5906 domain-containing protein [Shimia thalassica]